jgi:hypothetical protein
VTRHRRSMIIYTGIRVVISNSIPLYGTSCVDAMMPGIGNVAVDTNTDVDADGLWQAKSRWSEKKNLSAQPQTRRVASTPSPIMTGPGPVAVDSETALELLMLGHPLGMHT